MYSRFTATPPACPNVLPLADKLHAWHALACACSRFAASAPRADLSLVVSFPAGLGLLQVRRTREGRCNVASM